MPKASAVFAIDGFEISATFAESQNTAAIGQVKQIFPCSGKPDSRLVLN